MGREILETVAWKARVVAQNRRWQYTALYAKLRNNGQLHCDRAPAKAGDIVDEGDFLLIIVIRSVALHGRLSFAVSEQLAIIEVGLIATTAAHGLALEI